MNLYNAKAEFTRFLKLQDSVLKKKSRVKWFEYSDANTTFFHGVIKNRRKRLMIQKIKDMKGNWVERINKIEEAALKIFDHLFTAKDTLEDSSTLRVVRQVVYDELNVALTSIPNLEEVKEFVLFPLIQLAPQNQMV